MEFLEGRSDASSSRLFRSGFLHGQGPTGQGLSDEELRQYRQFEKDVHSEILAGRLKLAFEHDLHRGRVAPPFVEQITERVDAGWRDILCDVVAAVMHNTRLAGAPFSLTTKRVNDDMSDRRTDQLIAHPRRRIFRRLFRKPRLVYLDEVPGGRVPEGDASACVLLEYDQIERVRCAPYKFELYSENCETIKFGMAGLEYALDNQ